MLSNSYLLFTRVKWLIFRNGVSIDKFGVKQDNNNNFIYLRKKVTYIHQLVQKRIYFFAYELKQFIILYPLRENS